MKKILLIVTGSIAAYKIIDLIRLLEKQENMVTVIFTKSASKFVSILAIKSLCRAEIYQDTMFQEELEPMLHINLSRDHDLILVAPASANFIAKITYGFADSLASSLILAANTPIFLAPAMNPSMYNNQATQHNLNLLKTRNFKIIGPDYGVVACGEEGLGKYVEAEEINKFIDLSFSTSQQLKGKKAIVNLGSTHELIDPVRFIGNYSSGTQGMLIAQELASHGCEVQIIAGHVTIPLPKDTIRAYTAKDMLQASVNLLPADIYIGVAAICDFKPKTYSEEKIKKNSNNIILEFEPNIDVITKIAKDKNRPFIVIGFALESDNYEINAKQKLKNKNLDLIILNKAKFIGKNYNEFAICTSDSYEELGKISKKDLAEKLVNKIIEINSQKNSLLK